MALVGKASDVQGLKKPSEKVFYEKKINKGNRGIKDNENKIIAAEELVERLLPGYSDKFVLQLKNETDSVDFFEIEQGINGKVMIKGNRTVSLVSGVNYYLKHVAKYHFSWNGDQLKLPNQLPVVGNKIRKISPNKDN